jgi:hypothetical protein
MGLASKMQAMNAASGGYPGQPQYQAYPGAQGAGAPGVSPKSSFFLLSLALRRHRPFLPAT